MLNFFISLVIAAVSVFLMILALRYGLSGAIRLDNKLIESTSGREGFSLFYRIPGRIGIIPEYFYALILGHDNYFTRKWWALKTASFISVLLFIAILKSRGLVYSYYSLELLGEVGIKDLFTSGAFIVYLNIITALYAVLFLIICIESFRMVSYYAPVRILTFTVLCFLISNITIITLSIIVFITIAYLVIKIIWFFFFSSSKRKNDKEEDEESVSDIFSGGLREFRQDLYEWESEEPVVNNTRKLRKEKVKRRSPKITRRRKPKKTSSEDEIPRLHPD